MKADFYLLDLFDQGFALKTWHGPNLWQSLKGVTAKQAAWRPGSHRRNIWEVALHAAYWKYAVRRRLEGGKRGSFALPGSNFFPRPQTGQLSESAWKADKALLLEEHQALRVTILEALKRRLTLNVRRMLCGVAFHDVYHAGQIRLLRRMIEP
jgi:uncharacterized damage-inducible protein DinB